MSAASEAGDQMREVEEVRRLLKDGQRKSCPEIWFALGFERPNPGIARLLHELERVGEVVVDGSGLARTYRMKGRDGK